MHDEAPRLLLANILARLRFIMLASQVGGPPDFAAAGMDAESCMRVITAGRSHPRVLVCPFFSLVVMTINNWSVLLFFSRCDNNR